MEKRNAQAIANLQLAIALRLDKKNLLEKIIASEQNPDSAKSAARDTLAQLIQDDAADMKELERLKAER